MIRNLNAFSNVANTIITLLRVTWYRYLTNLLVLFSYQICNMLRKKQEEAKEILVRTIVNNNNLLMLNHPIYEEKISFHCIFILFSLGFSFLVPSFEAPFLHKFGHYEASEIFCQNVVQGASHKSSLSLIQFTGTHISNHFETLWTFCWVL